MPEDERVDGRDLTERDEPGSDDLLLRGLIRALAERVIEQREERRMTDETQTAAPQETPGRDPEHPHGEPPGQDPERDPGEPADPGEPEPPGPPASRSRASRSPSGSSTIAIGAVAPGVLRGPPGRCGAFSMPSAAPRLD
jgi:hypothetical protein